MTIVRSPYPDVTIPEVRFPDLVFADVATDGCRPALVDVAVRRIPSPLAEATMRRRLGDTPPKIDVSRWR